MLIRVLGRAAVITAVAGLLGTSCGDGSEAAAPSELPTILEVTPTATAGEVAATAVPTATVVPEPPTATPAPTVDERAALEAAVLEAHAGYLEAFFESGRLADPDYPPLLASATGASLRVAQESRARYRTSGLRVVGTYTSSARFLDVCADGSALVEDCLLDEAPAVDSAGAVVEPVDPHPIYLQTVLVFVAERWKVTETLTERAPCDF